jgi:hypothetical protein
MRLPTDLGAPRENTTPAGPTSSRRRPQPRHAPAAGSSPRGRTPPSTGEVGQDTDGRVSVQLTISRRSANSHALSRLTIVST